MEERAKPRLAGINHVALEAGGLEAVLEWRGSCLINLVGHEPAARSYR